MTKKNLVLPLKIFFRGPNMGSKYKNCSSGPILMKFGMNVRFMDSNPMTKKHSHEKKPLNLL